MIPGLPNPWLLLGATFAVLAMIVGSYLRGDAVGSARVQAAWDVQHATEQRDAIATGLVAEKRAHDAETAGQARINILETTHAADLEKINDLDRRYRTAMGTRGLRDAGGKCSGGNGLPDAASAPSSPANAQGGCELSGGTSAALWDIARRASIDSADANTGRDYGAVITEFRAKYGQNTAPQLQ